MPMIVPNPSNVELVRNLDPKAMIDLPFILEVHYETGQVMYFELTEKMVAKLIEQATYPIMRLRAERNTR